jgi:SAM-dependent methyltransferase
MSYETMARYYDVVHEQLTEDVPFLLALAQQCGGRVLELGCGTGRLMMALGRADVAVDGIDNSPAMLAIAQAKIAQLPPAKQNLLTLHQADMTNFDLGEQFDLVIIPYNTFLHLDSDQKKAALRQIDAHLAPHGQLFIDLPHPLDLAELPDDDEVTLEQVFTDPATGEQVAQSSSYVVDGMAQRVDIRWVYEKMPASATEKTNLNTQFSYHFVYPHEMQQMLENTNNGVSIPLQHIYGDYDQTPFDEDSPRLLLLAQKPRSHGNLNP